MRQIWIVFSEEMRRAWSSASTYVLLSLFFLITGILYISVFFQASIEPQRYSPLQLFWELQWLPNLVWIPLLTMRLLAPERKYGLLESTLSTPTTPAAIVLGKYLSVFMLYIIGWLSVVVYIVITLLGGLNGNESASIFSLPSIFGGALFCLSSGGLFLALGLWCSGLTRNTIIAGGMTVCLMLLYMLLPTMIQQTPVYHAVFLRPFSHLENLSDYVMGEISLSMIVAYAVLSCVLLFATMLSLEQKAE